jgi:hypothetical protein
LPDVGAAPQRDPAGMILPIAAIIARDAVRRQFVPKPRRRRR